MVGIREELGYEIKLQDGLTIVPTVGISYDEIRLGKFKDKGGRQEVEISSRKNRKMNALVGVNVSQAINMDGYTLVPSIHAGIEHALSTKSKAMKVTSVNDAADSTLMPQKKASKNTYITGAGIKLITAGKVEVGVNYDLVMREKFRSHNGSLKLRINL